MTSSIFYVVDNDFKEIQTSTYKTDWNTLVLHITETYFQLTECEGHFFTCPTVKGLQISNMFPCNIYNACYNWNTVHKI